MARTLDQYQAKRDPAKTPEPEGKKGESGSRLRFVVQHHAARSDHYDFRLEWDGVLLSWAVPKGPSYNPKDKRLAVEVEAHPLDYIDFEGTIPSGEYGAGVVQLWDEGEWEPREDVEQGLVEGSLKMVLKGERLHGKWALVRLKKQGKGQPNWLLIKEKDEFVQDDAGIADYTTSVRSGRTMAEIEAGHEAAPAKDGKLPFSTTGVQLAKLARHVPQETDWLFELKFDGFRIVAYIDGGHVRLMTRNRQDYTEKFPEVTRALADWSNGKAMVLDGEVVALDSSGRSDFQALQAYLQTSGNQHLTYVIFDLLALGSEDLRSLPLRERKEKLANLMAAEHPGLHYSQHAKGDGREIFLTACRANREGVIAKRSDSLYSGTRNGDWLKIKCENRQEFVIGGYTKTSKRGVSALLLGVYAGDRLEYVGRVGTGFTDKTLTELQQRLSDIHREASPFAQAPPQRRGESLFWVEPRLVAEISFSEWTAEQLLRQASFKGLRFDKEPRSVVREAETEAHTLSSGGNGDEKNSPRKSIWINDIRITSPDKDMFPESGISKEDVARYYQAAAARMLPYVKNRLLSVVRCPDGFPGECFYQKHLPGSLPGIGLVSIPEKDGDPDTYFYLEESVGLLSLVQMGTLEFHTWGSQVTELEKPDMLVFDLDPEEGLDLQQLRDGVRHLKGILDELSLVSFLKTSGGKGYHVVIPLEPSGNWDKAKDFARLTAVAMAERWPDRYTGNMRKEKRKGKIFIDWIRNARSATSVAPYSVRARPGAPVSQPLGWEELDTVAPNAIHIHEALKRLELADPWEDYGKIQQRLVELPDEKEN